MPRGNQTTMDRLSAMAGQVLEGKVLGEAAKADPKAMQTGPRGGKYYLDSRGRKVYGEPDGTSGGRGDNEPDDGAKSAPRAIADQIRAAGGDDVRGVIPKPDGSLVAVLKSGGMIAIRPDNNGTAVHALSPGFGAKWTQIGSAIPKGSRMADIDIKAGDTAFGGVQTATILGREVVTTIKNVFPKGWIYCFTDPEFIGKAYTLEDMKFELEKRFNVIQFQSQLEYGCNLGNIFGISKLIIPQN